MNRRKIKFHNGRMGSAIAVKIEPESSRNGIKNILDDGTILIQLTSPISEVELNNGLVEYLAEILDVPKSKIEIIAGEGFNKLVAIMDVDAEEIQTRIMNYF